MQINFLSLFSLNSEEENFHIRGTSLGLVPNEVNIPRCFGTGSIPSPLFYPFDQEGSGANLGLVPDEVTLPLCFGTIRKVYRCHPRPITSLYILGCVLSTNICFCNRRDHVKTSKYWDLLFLELQDHILTLTIHCHEQSRVTNVT